MNESTEKLVRELAEKLGTTAEHLWGVLTKQAPIDGWANMISWLVLAAICVGLLLFAKLAFKKAAEDPGDEGWLIASFSASIVCGFVLLVLVCFVCSDLSITITAFKNPEYWALKQIIK